MGPPGRDSPGCIYETCFRAFSLGDDTSALAGASGLGGGSGVAAGCSSREERHVRSCALCWRKDLSGCPCGNMGLWRTVWVGLSLPRFGTTGTAFQSVSLEHARSQTQMLVRSEGKARQ